MLNVYEIIRDKNHTMCRPTCDINRAGRIYKQAIMANEQFSVKVNGEAISMSDAGKLFGPLGVSLKLTKKKRRALNG